jgi:hypothetical protein
MLDLSSVSSNESSPHDALPRSEIVELQRAIHDTITNLFKLSMIIRKPTPRGRYTASKDTQPLDVSSDVAHVWQKFPHTRDHGWLVERLGKANTRRREYFRYRREHRRKLTVAELPNPEDTRNVENDGEAAHERPELRESSTREGGGEQAPTVTLTKATTFIDVPRVHEKRPLEEDNASLTSYATTTSDGSLHALRVPDPHDVVGTGMEFEYGDPFECPYCFTIQVVKDVHEWR